MLLMEKPKGKLHVYGLISSSHASVFSFMVVNHPAESFTRRIVSLSRSGCDYPSQEHAVDGSVAVTQPLLIREKSASAITCIRHVRRYAFHSVSITTNVT